MEVFLQQNQEKRKSRTEGKMVKLEGGCQEKSKTSVKTIQERSRTSERPELIIKRNNGSEVGWAGDKS